MITSQPRCDIRGRPKPTCCSPSILRKADVRWCGSGRPFNSVGHRISAETVLRQFASANDVPRIQTPPVGWGLSAAGVLGLLQLASTRYSQSRKSEPEESKRGWFRHNRRNAKFSTQSVLILQRRIRLCA